MAQDYGMPAPRAPLHGELRRVARWLVVIEDATGTRVARLFSLERAPLAEFDAATEEIGVMTRGLQPTSGAAGAEWDAPLGGHSAAERAAAEVYTLDL
jgi:hypothetical protein